MKMKKIKNNDVTFMELVYLAIRVSRTWRKNILQLLGAYSKTLSLKPLSALCVMSLSSEPVPMAFFVRCSRVFWTQYIKSEIENIRKDG